MMAFLITIGVLAVLIGISWLIIHTINFFFDLHEKKKRAKHPQFYEMTEELNRLSTASIHYHNDLISPLKREVNQLRKMDYDPDFVKVQKEILIEKLCAEIYEKEKHRAEIFDKPIAELRKRIKEYNDIHKVEKYWE